MAVRRRRPLSVTLAVVVVVAAACGGDGDGQQARPPVVTTLAADPRPMEGALDVTWACPRADACVLTVGGSVDSPADDLPAAGRRTVGVDFTATAYRPEVTLTCSGVEGDAEARITSVAPYIASFTATPPSVPAEGAEVVLCWELAQGIEPLCAIRAYPGGEYFYPLEAAGCLFPLLVDETSEFLLYCSPQNGYVEAPLVVPVQAP